MAIAVSAALWKSPLTHIMLGIIFLGGHTLISDVIADGALTTTECEWYNQTLCAQSSNNEGCSGTKPCEKWEDPEKKNHCFVVWTNNTDGKVEVTFKGCWMNDPVNCAGKTDYCVNIDPVHSKERIFCCCNGNNCNHNFSWQPSEKKPTTTPFLTASPVVSGDTVFNTVAWTLGTFFAVAVVITSLIYIYRRRRMGNFVELSVESTPLAPPSPALCQR